MVTVNGFTAERMLEIENSTVVAGEVVDGDLILLTRDETPINAGAVVGPVGPAGGAFIICTSSTRPTLLVSEEGKAIYETDTNLIRVWSGTQWKLQEKIICTSGSRPTMTLQDEGVKIYETDTNLEWTWDGTSWYSHDFNVNVAVYENEAARDAASPSPPDGALSALETAPGVIWFFASGVWNIVGDPPGSIKPFIGINPPVGHVLMYGQTIADAETLYPILWANVGAPWKSGANLFVPDLRGRVVAGKDNMGGTPANRLGSVGGLVGNQLGSSGGSQYTQQHTHNVSQTPHTHGVGETLIGTGPYGMAAGGKAISGSTSSAIANITLGDYGNGAGQNLQPTMVMNWILKVL